MITKDRKIRKIRVRAKIAGTAARPRLSVFKSARYFYAQLIDDDKGRTLAAFRGEKALEVGKGIAGLARKKKIAEVVFDRSGYKYHGNIKKIADGAREGGLKL